MISNSREIKKEIRMCRALARDWVYFARSKLNVLDTIYHARKNSWIERLIFWWSPELWKKYAVKYNAEYKMWHDAYLSNFAIFKKYWLRSKELKKQLDSEKHNAQK